jgi:hypothetical protein
MRLYVGVRTDHHIVNSFIISTFFQEVFNMNKCIGIVCFLFAGQAIGSGVYSRGQLDDLDTRTLKEIILVMQGERMKIDHEEFTVQDANACNAIISEQRSLTCFRSRVEHKIGALCSDVIESEIAIACFKANRRFSMNSFRTIVAEDITACKSLIGRDEQKTCFEHKTPAELTLTCKKFIGKRKVISCLRAG